MEIFTHTLKAEEILSPAHTHHPVSTNLDILPVLFNFSPLLSPQHTHTHTHSSLGMNLKENFRYHSFYKQVHISNR